MKSITEKMVYKIYEFASDLEDVNLKQSVESLASEIEKMEELATFEEVARVMIKHLAVRVDQYHPHNTVITTSTTCELVEGVKSVGIVMDYIPD